MTDPRIPAEDSAALLDRWLAGDLAPGGEEERALLARDPELRGEMDRHRDLRSELRALPLEIEPSRDLWPGVAARIGPQAGRAWWRPRRGGAVLPWLALAAALVAAVGLGWLLRGPAPGAPVASRLPAEAAPPEAAETPASPRTLASGAAQGAPGPTAAAPVDPAGAATSPAPSPRRPRSAPAPRPLPPTVAPVPVAADPTAAPVLAAYAETDRQLVILGLELRRTIEAQQDRLPPETRDVVFENLATIDRALAEIAAALASTPGDGDLARTYIEYRQREIALLRRANAMAARL